jgi:transcriptional regulator with XRE-family HTH domain
MDRSLIAAEVRRVRVAAGLTQAELARRTGTTQSAVSRLESGRLLPSLAVLERVAEAVGRPITVVVGGRDRPAPREPTLQASVAAPALRSVAPGTVSGRPLPSARRLRE